MTSPTQLTLRHLRKQGWLCGIVEKWNPHAKIRQDLFGFADVVAVRGDIVALIQTTTTEKLSARRAKIEGNPASRIWRTPSRIILLHGWSKKGARGKRKVWTLREEIV